MMILLKTPVPLAGKTSNLPGFSVQPIMAVAVVLQQLVCQATRALTGSEQIAFC